MRNLPIKRFLAAVLLLSLGLVWQASAQTFTPLTPGGANAGCTTTCGIQNLTVSSSMNVTGAAGYEQNGVTVLNQTNAGQGSLAVGAGAGAALPAGSIFSTFVGWEAGYSFTGSTGEATCIGTIACHFLTTGEFDTAIGEHAGGYWVTDSDSTAIGNDSQRDWINSSGGNTSLGKSTLGGGGGQNETAIGFGALQGNSSNVVFGGTPTLNDTETLTFVSTNPALSGTSPIAITITISSGETTTQRAAAMVAAINANTTLQSTWFSATNQSNIANQISFIYPGSCVQGNLICITYSNTGSATESATVTNGAVGAGNVGIGIDAMQGLLWSSAQQDVAIGTNTLQTVTTASEVVAIGYQAGLAVTTGADSVLIGGNAGATITTAQGAVAIGYQALSLDVTAVDTAIGYNAGENDTAIGQTLVGENAGANLTSGINNTVVGSGALQAASASTAALNSVLGASALASATSASENVVIGDNSGNKITTGGYNVLVGYDVAPTTLTTGSDNIILCTGQTACDTAASTTSNTFMVEGNSSSSVLLVTGTNAPSSQITTLPGILKLTNLPSDTGQSDVTVCQVTSSGELYYGSGTGGICLSTSTARYKTDIADQTDGLAQIMALHPVGYNYKPGHGYDPAKRYNGFLAEEMEPMLPGLVGHDAEGKPNSVDLMGLVPILVHAMQQQQLEIEALRKS